jgi:hypothetical protein
MKEYNPTNKEMFNSYLEMGYKALKKEDSKKVEMFYNYAKLTLTELLKENFLRKDAPQTADENLIKKHYIRQFGKFCKVIDIRNGYESFPMKTIPKRPIEKDGKISHIYSKETLENLKHLYDEDSNKSSPKNQAQKLIEYFPKQEEILDLGNAKGVYRIVTPEEINMRKSSKIEEKLTNALNYSVKFLKNLYNKTQENNLEAESLPKNWHKVKTNCKKYLEFGKNAKPLKRNLTKLIPTIYNKFTLRPHPVDLKIARYLI